MEYDENNVYGSGLNSADWHLLKNAILCASLNRAAPSEDFDRLPRRLREHDIGRIVANHLDGKPNGNLDTAAKKMVGANSKAWLALMKS